MSEERDKRETVRQTEQMEGTAIGLREQLGFKLAFKGQHSSCTNNITWQFVPEGGPVITESPVTKFVILGTDRRPVSDDLRVLEGS